MLLLFDLYKNIILKLGNIDKFFLTLSLYNLLSILIMNFKDFIYNTPFYYKKEIYFSFFKYNIINNIDNSLKEDTF